MRRISKLVLVLTTLILLSFAAPVVNAGTLIIGSSDQSGRYPFGLDPGADSGAFPNFAAGGIYQQVYTSSAFSGPITITQIAFASKSQLTSGPGTAIYNFNLALSTTAAGPGGLSTNFAANRGADFVPVFSGPFTATITDNDQFDMVIDIVPFTYDPANGNLLLEVVFNSPVQFSGGSVLYFNAGSSPSTSRAANPTGVTGGAFTDGFALQTRFTTKATAQVTLGNLEQTFDGSPKSIAVTTNPPGLDVVVTYDGSATPPSNAGSYTVTATVNDPNFAGQASGNLIINKASQQISFEPLPNKTFGDPDFNVSATASSNLAVSFAASGSCTVSGSQVHLTGTGSCTLTASQGGNSNFNAAADVQQSFSIAQVIQSEVTISDATVAEPASGSKNMLFTVILSPAPSSAATVNFTTADGGANPALADSDYTTTSGTLNFAAGQSIQTISVPVLADTDTLETDETFILNLTGASGATISRTQATATITTTATPSRVLISELRTSGPAGPDDEFVELYNNTDAAVDISNWILVKRGATCSDAPIIIATIPADTSIPARGHYLLTGSAYSLAASAPQNRMGRRLPPSAVSDTASNLSLTTALEDDASIALFSTSTLANIGSPNLVDAVGFGTGTGNNCDLLSEGENLPELAGSALEYSFVRRMGTAQSGIPKDTGDNLSDFILVESTGAVVNGVQSVVGTPGPENLSSPINRTSGFSVTLIEPLNSASSSPNRVRFGSGNSGSLEIRRRYTNNTGQTITRFRLRVIDITILGNQLSGQADVRPANSTTTTITPTTTIGVAQVQATTIELPAGGIGGLNSTVTAVLPGGGLAPGASLDLNFKLNVVQAGNFRYFVNIEALP